VFEAKLTIRKSKRPLLCGV